MQSSTMKKHPKFILQVASISGKSTQISNGKRQSLDSVSPLCDRCGLCHGRRVFRYSIMALFQKRFSADYSKTLQIRTARRAVRRLTQQLIKNQILTNEVSYERKAKEILLAMRLEHFMDKDEILEAYLNIIPYGRNANGQNIAGIETAAEWYFRYKSDQI